MSHSVRRIGRILTLAGGALLVAVFASAAPGDAAGDNTSFFPSPPAGVPTHRMSGILEEYGIGNHSGSLTLRVGGGRDVSFYVGSGLTIDGVRAACAQPPRAGYVAPDVACEYWPKKIVLGKTYVTVTYWRQVGFYGTRVSVTNTIRTQ